MHATSVPSPRVTTLLALLARRRASAPFPDLPPKRGSATVKLRLGVERRGREAMIHGRGEAELRGIGLTGPRSCRRL